MTSDEQIADLVKRLRSRNGERPHRFPQGASAEVFQWRCAACGLWINDLRSSPPCSVDWRGPFLEHEAADLIEQLLDQRERLIKQIHRSGDEP